jgi:hypothetical protein
LFVGLGRWLAVVETDRSHRKWLTIKAPALITSNIASAAMALRRNSLIVVRLFVCSFIGVSSEAAKRVIAMRQQIPTDHAAGAQEIGGADAFVEFVEILLHPPAVILIGVDGFLGLLVVGW